MFGKNIIRLDETDSTNNYARRTLVPITSVEGTVVLAQYQKSGRGHHTNVWESARGKNLTFTLILEPKFLVPSRQFLLSQVVSLGIADFISDNYKGVSVKWPNDIYVGDKKIGGVLIETNIKGSTLALSYVGIGININQEEYISDAPNPVSLKNLTKTNFDIDTCLEQVLLKIHNWYRQLRAGSFEYINSQYRLRMFRAGKWAQYKIGEKIVEGKITGIDEYGRLALKTRVNEQFYFQFKEIEYII